MGEFNEQFDRVDKHAPTATPQQQDGGPGHDHGLGLAATLGNAHVGKVLGAGVHRAGATSAQQLDESVARAIEDRRGRGQGLDEDTRSTMEQSLGHDLSDVRVHTDGDAHDLNEAVGARAFTAGSDVFFKSGTYDPSSSSGRELLGHELTHVVQQRSGMSGLGAGEVSHPSDPAEQHAEAVGKQIASGEHAAASTAAAPAGVARQEEPEEEESPMQMAFDAGIARAEEELEEEGP
jgi:hypothetical protein